MRILKLDTWYRKLIREQIATRYEIRFILRTKDFVAMPTEAKGCIYWREGEFYLTAMNHSIKWAERYVKHHPDAELWGNDKWMSKPKYSKKIGRPKKDAEPEFCRPKTAEQIKRALDKKRLRAMINMFSERT